MPRIRSHIRRLCMRMSSISVAILSSSSNVVNSFLKRYASRKGTFGSFSEQRKIMNELES